MILIIGGSNQGKQKAAMALLGITDEAAFYRKCANGETDLPEAAVRSPYVIGYHHVIRRLLEAGEDSTCFTRQVIERAPELVVMDEVGSGVVPMELKERQYREAVGCAGQMLAEAADAVYRVICGISVRLR